MFRHVVCFMLRAEEKGRAAEARELFAEGDTE